MRFESPLALLLLVLLPLTLKPEILGKLLRRDLKSLHLVFRQRAIAFSSAALEMGTARSWRVRWRDPLLAWMRFCAFLLLILALARPQSGTSFEEQEFSGRDIMIVLDTSGSMQALDFQVDGENVDRLSALKKVVTSFVKERRGDRIGLVVFGTEAYTQCPLTLDAEILTGFVDSLEIGMAGEQTALGDALAIGLKRMKDVDGDSKVVVLVTDGENTAGSIAPIEAARIAAKLGIKVHTIGIGTNEPVPFPAQTIFGRKTIVRQVVPMDEKTLTEMASISGGLYFNAQNTEQLEGVYKKIDELEPRIDKVKLYVDWRDYYPHFLVASLLLLLLEELLVCTYFSVLP